MVASTFQSQVSTRRVYVLGALAAVLFGYDMAIIGAALLFIKNDLPITDWWTGAVASAVMLGAMVGALGSGPLADRQGRQRLLLVAAVVFAVGAAGTGLATSLAMLVSFRFILGLAVGIASVMVPLYLAEMAPARDRGVVTSLNQYMFIVGVALASAVGFGLAFASSWRWMLLIGVIPAIVLLIGMLGMPDTPRSLVRRGLPDQGRAVLVGLRGDPVRADRELTEIVELERLQRTAHTRARLSSPWVRRLLLLGAGLAVFQQITGINAIVYYQPTVLTGLGMSDTTALLFGFVNGLVNIVTIALVVRSKVVDRRGRKPILLVGLVGMSVSLLALGVAALVLPVNSTALFVTAVAAIVVFTNTFSATWGPVLWVQLAEIFPLAIRGSAMAIATLFNWLAAFMVTLTFPALTALAGVGTVFIAYAVAGVVVFPIVWWVVPETKERSLESLEAAFRDGTRIRTAADTGGTA
ncbi:MAG: sugar porter family MFS transporter [Pseudonocardiaceae bacterium]